MKAFSALVDAPVPPAALFRVLRDRLPELTPAFDDVSMIIQRDHRPTPEGHIRVVNEWRVARRLPPVLARALGAHEVSWLDHAEWDTKTLSCSWRIEPSVLAEQVHCRGQTVYEPVDGGRASRVHAAGSFALERGGFRGLARALEPAARAFLEALVTVVVPRNTRTMVEAAAELVRDESEGHPGER